MREYERYKADLLELASFCAQVNGEILAFLEQGTTPKEEILWKAKRLCNKNDRLKEGGLAWEAVLSDTEKETRKMPGQDDFNVLLFMVKPGRRHSMAEDAARRIAEFFDEAGVNALFWCQDGYLADFGARIGKLR